MTRRLAMLGVEPAREFVLRPGRASIGSAHACEIVLPDAPPVAVRLEVDAHGVEVENAGAPEEVLLDGAPLTRASLLDDAVLQVGSTSFRYDALGEPAHDSLHIRVTDSSRPHLVVLDGDRARRVELEEAGLERDGLEHGDRIDLDGLVAVFKSAIAHDPESAPPASRRPVVIVPGLMGSQLWRGERKLWPSLRTFFEEPDLLTLPENDDLDVRGIVDELVVVPNVIKLEQYGRLAEFLEQDLGYRRGVDLLEFAYDWRKDCRLAARRLAEAVAGWEAAPEGVTIVAHSMGCLVSRYYVERLGGHEAVSRLILLGGPHAGAPRAVETLVTGPHLLPFGMKNELARSVLRTFPSLYQLLPAYECVEDESGGIVDIFEHQAWLGERERGLLRDARAFHAELGNETSVPTVCIYGYGLDTVIGCRVAGSALTTKLSPEGDDMVPQRNAVVGGAEVHPVEQHHGSLYADNDVKLRLRRELALERAGP